MEFFATIARKKGHITMNYIQHAKDLLDDKINIHKALFVENDEECLFEVVIEDFLTRTMRSYTFFE